MSKAQKQAGIAVDAARSLGRLIPQGVGAKPIAAEAVRHGIPALTGAGIGAGVGGLSAAESGNLNDIGLGAFVGAGTGLGGSIAQRLGARALRKQLVSAKSKLSPAAYTQLAEKGRNNLFRDTAMAGAGAGAGAGAVGLASRGFSQLGDSLREQLLGTPSKTAAHTELLKKAARIKLAGHLLRMNALQQQLANLNFAGLTKAAAQGHSKAQRLKYAMLAAQYLTEKQAFAGLLRGLGAAGGAISRGLGGAASGIMNRLSGSPTQLVNNTLRAQPQQGTQLLSQTGPSFYGRLNNALFPKKVIGQPGPSEGMYQRLQNVVSPNAMFKVSAMHKQANPWGLIGQGLKGVAGQAWNAAKAHPRVALALGATTAPTVLGALGGGIGGAAYGGAQGLYHTFAQPMKFLGNAGERLSAAGSSFLDPAGSGGYSPKDGSSYSSPYRPAGHFRTTSVPSQFTY